MMSTLGPLSLAQKDVVTFNVLEFIKLALATQPACRLYKGQVSGFGWWLQLRRRGRFVRS